MEKLCLSILRKLNKSEILSLVILWGRLKLKDVDMSCSKAFLKEEILARCRQSKISYHQMAELHLLMYMKHPSKYRWEAFRLQDKLVENCSARNKHKDFKKLLLKALGEKCTSLVTRVQEESQSYWCRFSAHEGSLASFLIYFPQSEYFLMSKSAVHLKKIAINCLPETLGYDKCAVLSLSGKYPHSLAQILLHTSQGKPENYTADHGYYRPKKRKSEVFTSDEDKNMRTLNREKRRKEIELNNQAFGDQELPILEDLSILMHTRLKGNVIPSLSQNMTVKAKVTFKGKDVLEALRNMVKDNTAVAPLPKHMKKIPLLGSNNLILYDRWQKSSTLS